VEQSRKSVVASINGLPSGKIYCEAHITFLSIGDGREKKRKTKREIKTSVFLGKNKSSKPVKCLKQNKASEPLQKLQKPFFHSLPRKSSFYFTKYTA